MRTMGRLALMGVLVTAFACSAPAPSQEPKPAVSGEPAEEAAPEPEPPSVELEQIKTKLEAVKSRLLDEGEYNCCIQPSCNWCALHEGSCQCFTNLMAGEAVCPGCGLGWHNRQGIAEGIDPGDVEWNITHEHPSGGHEH